MGLQCAVAIFACNEEQNITSALKSVLGSLPKDADAGVHVLANGCRDRTAEFAENVARRDARVVVHRIVLGDKCNAWNTYVHEISDARTLHFFMDGDVTCSQGSLEIMATRLEAVPGATAVAGVPQAGRNRASYFGYIERWGWLFANLYAVSGAHLERIKQLGIRLPKGLLGDDHFITRLMHSELDPTWRENPKRVIYDPRAGYLFRSLSPYRLRDAQGYLRRLTNYRLRQLQLARIGKISLRDIPVHTAEIDADILRELRSRAPKPWDYTGRRVRRYLEQRLASS